MSHHGFVRLAAAVPQMRVAYTAFNAAQVIALLQRAEDQDVQLLVYPELCLTGYTCGDLFHQPALLEGARAALAATNPQGRLVTPEEVANTVLWLASPAARSITGQAIVVAGGEVMAG